MAEQDDPAQSRQPRAILFANPRSGRGKQWLFEVTDLCGELGIDLVAVHFNLDESRIREALDSAAAIGVRSVLVSGGDGTVGTVAACVRDSKFVLGVLPAGTANDFARSLHIPLDPRGALELVTRGSWTRVDLAQAGDRLFCHAATIGINTEFARAADALRSRLGRLSYPLACIRVYLRRSRVEMTIGFDGRRETIRAFEVAFVNAPVYGGPLELEVDAANLTDRSLAIVVVQDIGVRVLLHAALLLLRGRRLRLDGVESFSAPEISVDASDSLHLTIDGEEDGTTPCKVCVLPSALRVYAPKELAAETNEPSLRD